MCIRERGIQQGKARDHARQWRLSARYLETKGAQGCTAAGGITSVCHPWQPNVYGSNPVPFTDEEQHEEDALRQDARYQQRVERAVRAYLQYYYYGGLDQCFADNVRAWNNRESARPHVIDARRCPRCCALGHRQPFDCLLD